ncbi:MAG: hypothetical protein AAF715_32530 [Myxococcota bacterium]
MGIRATLDLPADGLTVVAPAPELVSQATAEANLSIPRRTFLDSLGPFRAAGGEVIRLGRLRLVDRVEFVSWLRGRAAAAVDPDEVEDDTAAALRVVGMRPAGGGR